jgi:hypothetical protein
VANLSTICEAQNSQNEKKIFQLNYHEYCGHLIILILRFQTDKAFFIAARQIKFNANWHRLRELML